MYKYEKKNDIKFHVQMNGFIWLSAKRHCLATFE